MEMQPKRTRAQKIELLNAIKRGEINPQDLQPSKVEFWHEYGKIRQRGNVKYTQKIWQSGNVELTEKEFKQYQKQQGSNTRFIILVECEGCEPIQEISEL